MSSELKTLCITKAVKSSYYLMARKSTLYGLKFTAMRGQSKTSRILWSLLVVILSLSAVGFMLLYWNRFISFPTRYIVKHRYLPIGYNPFPSITIYPQVNVDHNKLYRFIKHRIINNPNEEVRMKYSNLNVSAFQYAIKTIAMFPKSEDFSPEEFKYVDDVFKTANLNLLDFMKEMSFDCDQLFKKCQFDLVEIDCNQLFEKEIALHGYHCRFNSLNSKIPERRSINYGLGTGLTVIARSIAIRNDLKVFFTSSSNFPDMHSTLFTIPRNKETNIGITPMVIYSEPSVKDDFSSADRGCLFPDERPLMHFKYPTYKNCLSECRIIANLYYCHCVPFYYKELTVFKLCQPIDYICLHENRTNISRFIYNNNMHNGRTYCNCVPDCNVLLRKYTLMSWQVADHNYSVLPFYTTITRNHTILNVSYTRSVLTALQRAPKMNGLSLLANIGGMLSLFLGCSFITAAEILYFCVFIPVRLYFEYLKELTTVKISRLYERYEDFIRNR